MSRNASPGLNSNGSPRQRLNTLEQKSKTEARKRDTRRKIIVGGAVIAQMEKDQTFADAVAEFFRHRSGGKMTARPLPICSTPPPASPARRLPKERLSLPQLPRA